MASRRESIAEQLSLPLQGDSSPAPLADVIVVEGAAVALRFVRHPRARRYVLRLSPQGEALVTVPRRGSKREARRFAEAHRAWIARERRAQTEALARTRPLAIGDTVLVGGTPRVILRDGREALRIGDARVPLEIDVHETVRRWLRSVARAELPARLRQLGSAHGLPVRGVSIRNQRTRWGSCSTDGCISLNWRLVQMPADVRDYVLLHELMHLKVRNHSAMFWREVERVCPDYARSREWLRGQGRELL
jgi:predicted metal-dependent hydrolase